MDTTPTQIADWVRQQVAILAQDPRYGGLQRVYRALSESSGLSESLVAKFYQGAKGNPQLSTLESLQAAIKEAQRQDKAA